MECLKINYQITHYCKQLNILFYRKMVSVRVGSCIL